MYTDMKRGFSLVEMLISILMISAAVAVGTLVIGAIKGSRDAAYENTAFRVANSKLDDLRAGGYAALPASGTFTDPALALLPQGSASTTVTTWNSKTKQVVTGVSWSASDGTTRYTTITTLITQVGGL